jgi:hypothetical protein
MTVSTPISNLGRHVFGAALGSGLITLAWHDYNDERQLRYIVDWYCPPNFDSPSVFGAILDDGKGGRFQISPIADDMRCKQFYWPSTNILVTRFAHADGIAELEDFMPAGLPPDSPWCGHVFRRIRCVRGAMRISLVCRPAFDYGRATHETSLSASGVVFKSQNMSLALCSAIPVEQDGQGGVTADFVIEEGQSQVFALRDGDTNSRVSGPPSAEEAEELFQRTVKFWRHWISGCTYRGRWRELVERSALVLKLLTFEPTGADRRSPHDQSSRSDRRDAQLGLSLYLAARRGLYRLCVLAPRPHRGSRGFCQLDSELCGPAPTRGEEVAGGLHHPRRQSAARGNFGSLGGISAIEARAHWQRGSGAISKRHLRRSSRFAVPLQQVREPDRLRLLGENSHSARLDLRELAISGRGNLGDAESPEAFRLFEGNELGGAHLLIPKGTWYHFLSSPYCTQIVFTPLLSTFLTFLAFGILL